ncbi:MAG TPA: ribonuclease P [Candidatus Thermoplasmatota archaeon]|nr:ribonuclease P [Candidatus Thermoplasmatota archaeon]
MRRDKKEERAIARDRIARLVELAEAAAKAGHVARADRYADLGWRVKTTYQLRGTPLDGRVCRRCRAFLSAGAMRVRLQAGHRSVTCLRCGHVRRRRLPRAKP